MTPVAAYYIFVANEQAREAAEKYRVQGPSLGDRVRAFVAARRQKAPVARPSSVARTA